MDLMYVISHKITSIQSNPFLIKTTFMKQLLFLMFLSFSITHAFSQNSDCKVLLDSIKGTYEGGCKNGKADGTGTAVGVATYNGEFKNGLPEGQGKYTWQNGDYYFGGWRKGLKEGKGEMHLPVNGMDSVIYGYWKKGVYVGQYESPYKIVNVSSDIGRVEVNKISAGKTSITITVENLVGGGSLGFSPSQTLTKMTEHRVSRGSYMTKTSTALTNKEVTVFNGVIFPFKVWMSFGNSNVEIEFYENADWDVRVPINK
jgi:hypothetical protein